MNDLHFSSQNFYYVVAATATLLGILYKVFSTLGKTIKNELISLKDDRKKLHVVFSEMTTNHGSSIKDKVNALEKSIIRNNELTEKIFFRQRWIMENQNIPIFESDKDGLCVWVNEEYAHFFGKSASFFLGNGWKNIIHPDDRKRVEEHWNNCVRDKIDAENIFRVITDGKIIIVKIVANKTESGYIGSIVKKGCENGDCLDCKDPERCKEKNYKTNPELSGSKRVKD